MSEPRSKQNHEPREPVTPWLFLGVLLFGLIIINAVWLVPALNEFSAQASNLRLQIASRAADTIQNFIFGRLANLQVHADDLRFGANNTEITAVLNHLLKENPEFNAVSALDGNYKEIIKVSRLKVVMPSDLADYSGSALPANLRDKQIYLGPVTRTENLQPSMQIAAAIAPGGGGRLGALSAELNLEPLSERIGQFDFGSTGKTYLIDSSGLLIIDSDVSLVLKHANVSERPIVRQLLADKTSVASLRYTNEKGAAVEGSGLYLEKLRWGIISEESVAEANRERDKLILFAVLSFAIGVLLLALLSYSYLRLSRLNTDLREYLHENYESAKILVRRDREAATVTDRLEQLNAELNDMAKTLVRRDLELTEANSRLQELDTAKSEFVSVAAHQLRTPLTGIRWSYHTLLEKETGALNEGQRKLLEEGLRTTLRMVELINDLLNVARIEEGRYGFAFKRQQLSPIIQQSVLHLQDAAAEKGITIHANISESPLPALDIDAERFAIVIDNLLDNGMKYTAPGGTVSVDVSAQGDAVRITVRDTGIGIPREQLPRVFSKFFRADNALLFQTAGTGLGLYVVKNIVERHNGTVAVESQEGKGTSVIVSLPIPKEQTVS